MIQPIEFSPTPAEGSQGSHLVQFYGADPSALVHNVAGFIEEGLEAGDSVLVIATPAHSDAFMSALGANRSPRDTRLRRLVFLDAQTTLDQFMCEGQPDWRRFERVVGGAVRGMRRSKRSGGLRAYGEMVGILWSGGQTEAALRLEKFWNILLSGDDFRLFCGYPIDIFDAEFCGQQLHDVLCAHTHVIPDRTDLEAALDRAIGDVLGMRTEQSRSDLENALNSALAATRSPEAKILWLRDHHPQSASDILARAREGQRQVQSPAS